MLSIYNFLKVKLCYRTYWKQWLAFLAICFLVFACSDDSSDDCNPIPNLETFEASSITYNTAVLNGLILLPNCLETVTSQGFVYSTEIFPEYETDNYIEASGSEISAMIEGLQFSTTYYYRTYFNNPTGTYYGDVVSFTTPENASLRYTYSGSWWQGASVTDLYISQIIIPPESLLLFFVDNYVFRYNEGVYAAGGVGVGCFEVFIESETIDTLVFTTTNPGCTDDIPWESSTVTISLLGENSLEFKQVRYLNGSEYESSQSIFTMVQAGVPGAPDPSELGLIPNAPNAPEIGLFL